MKVNFLFLFLFLFFSSQAQITKKVMFVGNSYTQYNNLPNLISQIAQSSSDILIYDSNLIGGSSFMDHVSNQVTINKINANQWDYVVLQEQSQKPAFSNNYVNNYVFPYANQLSELIRENYACSVPLFYTTWGRQNGDPQICLNGACTYEVMDNFLQQRYYQMAQTNRGVISPVAQVWRYIRSNHPNVNLYASDQSHPSLEGSMAAAYTFYVILFKKDPTLVTFNSSLTAQNALIIKNAVKEVVFDHLEDYFVDTHDNFADFNFIQTSGANFDFTNSTPNASNFIWNFGDGTTDNVQNPSHNYSQTGTFNVTLSLSVCGKNYIKTKQVNFNTLSNNDFFSEAIKIYPNPTSKVLYVSTLDFDDILIFDVLGKQFTPIFKTHSNFTEVLIESLAEGHYILQIQKEEKINYFRFIKK